MKILLIDPPRKYWDVFLFNTPSIALAHLSGYLKAHGHNVALADLYGLDSPWKKLEEIVKREKPDLAAVTCTVAASSYDAVDCACLVKMIDPKIKTIGGGFMFTAIPSDFLQAGHFDYACIGEGEITLGELADTIEKKGDVSKVKGIAYQKEGKTVFTEPRPFVEDLNTLPMPDWSIFDMKRYSVRPMGGNVAMALTNSRGCVNSCSFCSEALLWKSVYRSFSARWTCENLEILTKDHHKTVFIFGDNDFLYDRERLEKFIKEMKRRRIRAYFWIEASVGSILKNHDLLPALREVGGFNVQVGLESVCPEVLNTYNKPQTLEEMKKAIALVREKGFSVTGLFIWGDKYDSLKSLKDGVSFINKHADFIAPSIINPFPGTPYFEKCQKEGRIKERNLWKYNQHHVLMPVGDMSVEEAAEAYENTAYSLPVLMNMFYQALFSPYRPARMWAWEFIMLDLRFLFPRYRKPGGQLFEDYLNQTGRKVPQWKFPYPRKSTVSKPRLGLT